MVTDECKAKRLKEWTSWLGDFRDLAKAKYNVDIHYSIDAASRLNECYWETLNTKVKPQIGHAFDQHVDRHKIASATEMVIMHILPIEHDNEETRETLNAEFAIVVAKTLLVLWSYRRLDRDVFYRLTPSFNREHIAWLRRVRIECFPIFSNAGTWYAMEELAFAYKCFHDTGRLPGAEPPPR